MRLLFVLFIIFVSINSFADSCRTITKYDEMISTLYVVCPNLPEITDKQAASVIRDIFSSRNLVPDEYQIYFVKSLNNITEQEYNAKTLVGRYHTHDSQLTIWPYNPAKKRVIQLDN